MYGFFEMMDIILKKSTFFSFSWFFNMCLFLFNRKNDRLANSYDTFKYIESGVNRFKISIVFQYQ